MKSTPDYLYHYTTINSLGFILKNHNIRFNNLCNMDDIDEGIYSDLKWGKYCFVSSWTNEVKESIEMWKMYSNDMNGIRIKLKTFPFKEYDVPKIPVINEKDTIKSLVPFNEIHNKNYSFVTYKQQSILCMVKYNDISKVDNIRNANPVVKTIGGGINFDISNIGKMKNEYWGFQKEWRYILFVFPLPSDIDDFNYTQMREKIENVEKLPEIPFNDYYLQIEDNVYNEMEILIGPKTNDIDIKIVELLVREYNPSAKVTISCLRNRIR